MSHMYKIEPFASDVEVKPNFDFYRIDPIHQHLNADTQSSKQEKPKDQPAKQEKSKEKPAKKEKSKDQSAKQENSKDQGKTLPGLTPQEAKLIEALKNFNLKLDKQLEKHGVKIDGKEQQPKKVQEPHKSNEKPAKAESKKADKKAEKKGAKDATKQERPAAVKPGKAPNQPPLTVPETKSSASVSYRRLDCALDPFGYKNDAAKFQIQLQCQSKDKRWVEALASLAQKRGIQIGESVTGDRAIKVKYSQDAKITLEGSTFEAPLHDRVAIWKAIGSLLGLFDHLDAALSASTHQWLRVAEQSILGEMTSESLVRSLCNRLSANDFVGAFDIPTLSDYILLSLVADEQYLPNNLELWAKRLQ